MPINIKKPGQGHFQARRLALDFAYMPTHSPDILLKTLAEPTRLRIMLLLNAADELCVCDLHSILGISQPKISRHLQPLRVNGLVNDRREGIWVYYRLNPDMPDWLSTTLQSLQQSITGEDPYLSDQSALKAIGNTSCCD